MPLVKFRPGGFMRLTRVILAEILDGSVLALTKGRGGDLPVRTQIRSLRMLGPLEGAMDVSGAGHPLCCFIHRSSCSRRL
jgi:hypothetical protein